MSGFFPKAYWYFVLGLLINCMPLFAYAQVTTVGKDFWFGFMENNRVSGEASDNGVVIITASEPASGIIQYNNKTVNFNIAQGEQFMHKITDFDVLHRTSETVEKKGVYINSSGNISVYAFNERFRSADGTVILPLPTLGKDYLVTSHYEVMSVNVPFNANINDESTLLVVAVEDNTLVEITPSVFTLSGKIPNKPFTVTLNTGDSYQIKAKEDLTGSRVRVIGENVEDCKNLAVFGGNKWTSVGNCGAANDHLFQQAYPVNTWGTEFIHIPLLGRTSGELVKVLASENGTGVFVDGVNKGVLNAGKFFTFDLPAGKTASINTTKPASVTVFAKSQECNDPNQAQYTNGDPFMITYSPNQQLLKNITFNALQLPSIQNHYVNVIVGTGAVNKTLLDGQNVGNLFKPIPQAPGFSFAQIPIVSGVHTLSNLDGLIAYVYGFGFIESYGFAVGASLDNLNFKVEGDYAFQVEGERVACLDSEGNWEIFPENSTFRFFVWDFGDGTPTKTGKNVKHTYTKSGSFEIKILASVNATSCDQQEEVILLVEVSETEGEVIGATKVCPNVEEATYTFQSTKDFSKVEWQVEGGIIKSIDENANTVTVLWGASNPNAKVIAFPFTKEGCPGKEVVFVVNINIQIEAVIPEGDVQICFDPGLSNFYSVPNPRAGRSFEWSIEGGTIKGSNTGVQLEVVWDQPGILGAVWYREFSTLDNICEGTSPKLVVEVNNKMDLNLISLNHVKCFGENTGSIEVFGEGGTGTLRYVWSHDPLLNSPKAENLVKGLYSVTLIDGVGCEQKIIALEILEPQPLLTEDVQTFAISCVGKADGKAEIKLSGGVPPYIIDDPRGVVVGNTITVNSLEGTFHEFTVSDQNGCQIPVLLEIESPLPFPVGVRISQPSCPGEATGGLYVEMDNQFSPYNFIWEYDNSTGIALGGLPRGSYTVTVIDSRGCVSSGVGELQEKEPIVRLPTGYKPKDGFFAPVATCNLEYNISVYNRWGQLVYKGDLGWDGTVEGTPAPIGTYSYYLIYFYELNGILSSGELKGNFTLLR
jgi:hypothetical protein